MTIGYGDLKKGMAIDLEGEPHVVVEYERSKMQQRAPTSRVRFRSIKTGRVVDRSFSGFDVKFKPAAVERRTCQYIYREDELHYFMDQKTFEQFLHSNFKNKRSRGSSPELGTSSVLEARSRSCSSR